MKFTVGKADQVIARVGIQHDFLVAKTALAVTQGAVEDGIDIFAGQGFQFKDPRARNQGGDDIEVGVFGGRADQHQHAAFYMRQQGILLGFVPTVMRATC